MGSRASLLQAKSEGIGRIENAANLAVHFLEGAVDSPHRIALVNEYRFTTQMVIACCGDAERLTQLVEAGENWLRWSGGAVRGEAITEVEGIVRVRIARIIRG